MIGPFGIWKLAKIKNRRDHLVIENINKAKADADMENNIKRLKTDPDYQEKTLRKSLGLVKDNDIIYKFTDTDKKKDKQ